MKLLLVDEAEASATAVSNFLGARYRLLHARNGADAWNTLADNSTIQIAVVDIAALRANNYELLHKIRTSESHKNILVIALTSAGDQADRAAAFGHGVQDFLRKPIDPIELQVRIATHQILASTIRTLEANQVSSYEQATTDPLTKLKNRRELLEQGRRHMALARRNHKDLAIVSMDIDYLKRINDTYGHPVGNQALAHVGQLLRERVRTEDLAARIGGEEFAILLPDTNLVGAAVFAERMRTLLERTPLSLEGKFLTLTVSVGVASLGEDGGDSVDHLLMVADRRLLVAKQSGRNRVVTRQDELKRPAI